MTQIEQNNTQSSLPLVFFFIGFIIILIGLFSKYALPSSQNRTGFVSINSPMQQKKTINLDFTHPVECQYKSKQASVSAFLQDASMKAIVTKSKTVSYYQIENDCLYMWDEGDKKGKRVCGVGQVIVFIKQLAATDMFDSLFEDKAQSLLGKGATKRELIQSCKNRQEIPRSIFTVPKGIIFEGR